MDDDLDDLTVAGLGGELEEAVQDGSWFVEACVRAYEVRNCLWAGQHEDGKKHGSAGAEAFPWEAASDVRIRLADQVINDNARILRLAMKRGMLQASPVESRDAAKATAVTTFMKVLFGKRMAQNLRREIPLLANWQELCGLAVLAISYDQEVRIRKRRLSIDELSLAVAEAQQVNRAEAEEGMLMLEALWDVSREEEVAAWLAGMFEDLRPGVARRCVRALRKDGECNIPVRRVVRSQPQWTALRPFHDVFFPVNTMELASARWIAWREPLSEVELRARVLTDDYDEGAVEEACEKRKGVSVLTGVQWTTPPADNTFVDDMDELIEVFHMYRREVDAEGFTKIRVVHFCMGCEVAFLEEELDYAHEQYPFIDFVRDRTERVLLANRGVPSLISTHQAEIKTQRDFRTDRTSMTINPPLEVPLWRADKPLTIGPGRKLPYRKLGENQWLKPPQFDGDTLNIEKQVRDDVDEYFGRIAEGVHPSRQMLYQQSMVDDWLTGLIRAVDQTLALVDEFDPGLFEQVTGLALGEGESIRGEVDLLFDFNAADLNMEYALKKAEVMNRAIIPTDSENVIDRAAYTNWLTRSIDPLMASIVVRDVESVRDSEAEDEQKNFALIMAGTEPAMKENGQNYGLRLRVLEGILQANQEDIGRDLQNKPVSAQMLQRRMEHLKFQVQQLQNATIGRIGAVPALGAPGEQ